MTATAAPNAMENTAAQEREAPAKQGDLTLLAHPVALELFQSALPLRLAYTARDGTPRLVAVLFHWTGEEIVFTSWPDDPKVAALQAHPQVALTIDTSEPPFKVLSIRGTAEVTILDGLPPEALSAFTCYHGLEQGRAWFERMNQMSDRHARIAVRPSWAGVLDFETRFPSGMTKRLGPSGGGSRGAGVGRTGNI